MVKEKGLREEAVQGDWVLLAEAGDRLEISISQWLVSAWMGLWLCPRGRMGLDERWGALPFWLQAAPERGSCRQGWGVIEQVTAASTMPKVVVLKLALGLCLSRDWATLTVDICASLFLTSVLCCRFLQEQNAAACSLSWRNDCCRVPGGNSEDTQLDKGELI